MITLEKDMSTLEDNISMNNTDIEKLNYSRIRSMYDQLEIWTAYNRDKNPLMKKKWRPKYVNTCFLFGLFLNQHQFCHYYTLVTRK